MKTFRLTAKRPSEKCNIICKSDITADLTKIGEQIRLRGGMVVTDHHVFSLYQNLLSECVNAPVFVMRAGERMKNARTLLAILRRMAEEGLHRNSLLVAFGGGVVGDICGLAASLYMRGIPYIQVPTTLLAQVDSSVGGKTAVDFCGVKNLVGSFKQPELVLVSPQFFKTLPRRELRCGLGEIVKHGALCGELFDALCAQKDLYDRRFLAQIVPKNIAVKADIVRRDPLEKDLRKWLNLGHTTGHAVELAQKNLSHGECVLIGMMFESEFAIKYAGGDAEYLAALKALCRRILSYDLSKIDVAQAAQLARLDKKNRNADEVTMTVPVRKGEVAVIGIPFATYERELVQIKETLL